MKKKNKTKPKTKQNKKTHTQNRETSLKTACWLIGFQSLDIGHLKQQRRRRATKTSLKNWMRAASNFIALILSRLIRQMLAFFLELNSKELYQSSEKEKESCCLVFPSSTKREIRHFCIRELKQQRRRRQRKRHLRKWIRIASNFIARIPSRLLRQMLANVLRVEF